MENNDIILRKAVLHILDNCNKGMVLSNSPLDLIGDQLDFLRNILKKILKMTVPWVWAVLSG